MKKSSVSYLHEKIVAHALAPIAKELRLIDIADLIALLRFEKHASLSDLITSSAELYFLPGTVKLGSGGDYSFDWGHDPKIHLDLEISLHKIQVYVRLTLEKDCCGIEIDHINFMQHLECDESKADCLRTSFERAAFSHHQYNHLPEIRPAV